MGQVKPELGGGIQTTSLSTEPVSRIRVRPHTISQTAHVDIPEGEVSLVESEDLLPDGSEEEIVVADHELTDLQKLRGFEIVLGIGRRLVSVESVVGVVGDQVKSALALRGIRFAKETIPTIDLRNALKRNPLFQTVGYRTMQEAFDGSQSVLVPQGAEIIGANSKLMGMFIPTEKIRVQISTGEGSSLKVKVRELDLDSYLGEYVMAVGSDPTATVTNLSPETEMIFIPQNLFDSFHPRSQEAIKCEILRRSPLVNYSETDPALNADDSESNQSAYIVCEERKKGLEVFQGLPCGYESADAFRPHFIKTYNVGDPITPPKVGYLGFIIDGDVSVNQNKVGDKFVAIKKAEIQAGNTIFKANAVGVKPPENIELTAQSGPKKKVNVLWVCFSPDDENYQAFLDAALDGQAAKLAKANLRAGVMNKL